MQSAFEAMAEQPSSRVEYGVRVEDEELTLENFETIESIARLIQSKRPPDGGSADERSRS